MGRKTQPSSHTCDTNGHVVDDVDLGRTPADDRRVRIYHCSVCGRRTRTDNR